MEVRLNRLPDLGYEEAVTNGTEKITVAVTTLAFKNAEIISLLR